MQVHAFAAKHAFINRVLLIAFYRNIPLFIFIHYHTASYAAITASGGNRTGIYITHDYTLLYGPYKDKEQSLVNIEYRMLNYECRSQKPLYFTLSFNIGHSTFICLS